MFYSSKEPLLSEYALGELKLANRVIMSSLTRGRSTNADLAPTALHATYYAQRASAGLILTESTWVSPRGIGFIHLPGIFSQAQVEGWKLVTQAVHAANGRIFLQIVHSGAVSHPDFFNGQLPLGPSAINPREKTFTPNGFIDTLTPNPYTVEEISKTIEEFRKAAEHAKAAGFDGIEVHAQLFTLIPQFLSTATNQRTDEYGGNIPNRARLLFEILDALSEVYPSTRIGVKFTPVAFNMGMIKPDVETIPTYEYILEKLNAYNLAYVHLVGPATDLKGTAVEALAEGYFQHFRRIYRGTLMANLGFTRETGNAIIAEGLADLVSFGTPFIANPDLVERFDQGVALAEPDRNTFYTGAEKGYIDYPRATK
jgi:N-ethylmaleimide reductase